jgi:hypothetical protein
MIIGQIVQETFEYDADGRQTNRQQILTEFRKLGKCRQSGCAVWIDGRCTYNETIIKKEG